MLKNAVLTYYPLLRAKSAIFGTFKASDEEIRQNGVFKHFWAKNTVFLAFSLKMANPRKTRDFARMSIFWRSQQI